MFCAGEDICCAGDGKVDACCSATEETDDGKNKGREGEIGCCELPDKTKPSMEKACKDDCCGSEDPAAEIAAPSCCEGKASPCCDTTCLDELALGACEGSSSVHCCDGDETRRPCEDHTRSIYQLYAERLAALGCICRLLVSLGRESCCDRKERRRRRLPRRGNRRSEKSKQEDCCSGKEEQDCTKADSCKKACCQLATPNVAVNPLDLEMGGDSASDTEHVVLSISGMTCTGCETKLSRSLGGLPAVTNVKTSLVLSRAEFDLVPGPFPSTVEDVMRHVARTTEFSCERVAPTGTRLDLAVPGDAGKAEGIVRLLCEPASWPSGVTDVVVVVNKQTVRVAFDPIVVGARELLQGPWTDFADVGRLTLAPQPATDPTLQAGRRHVHQLAWTTVFSAVLTIPVLVLAWAPLPQHDMAYGGASLALATAVQVVVAGPLYPRAIKSLLFAHMVEMDLLVVLSTSAAYVFSVVSFGFLAAGRPLATGEFFETSTLLVTLIVVGRFVAALARQKAVESMSVRSLQAANALLVENGSDSPVSIDARLLQYGDVFLVMPDTRVPTDGTVLAGSSEVDESMITGESLPVAKQPGSAVVAGTVNGSGLLRVRLTRLPGDNTVSALASLADEARLSKPRIQALADRVASCFVPVVVALAVLTFVVWLAVGIAVRRQSASDATIQAVTYAITVLIVSCPCAIGLAVPMVVVVAGGLAARHGVLFASSAALELAHRTTDVVFDKTGTLTEGRPVVVHEAYENRPENRPDGRSLLLGLVSNIKHPVSRAVAAHLSAQGVVAAAVTDVQSLTGKGVQGRSASGQTLLQAGNTRWLAVPDDDSRVQQAVAAAGRPCTTVFCLAVDGDLAAVLCLADTVRADAASTVAVLHRDDIHVHILSGDDADAVDAVAAQLGVPASRVRSRCSPADKMEYVRDLVASGVVVFCGDGINDAAALAQATVGVHMAAIDDDNNDNDNAYDSSPIAAVQVAADVVLMRPCVAGVLTVMAVSRAAVRRIAWNFAWSAVYNVFAVLLAAGAFVHARIPPAYAGLGELVSVLPVIAAAVMLRWTRV